ncbi:MULTISPECIES: GNAT family N-acetyltransferase [unclassified Streptomyces]|uniref:GNAT family N-acetyltransferase n=1 Tax=unclassified Streptomyces TaxID=2593676 RepID=UPI002E1CB853|nr:GNAT family N-acetyltransferase [Streptomyces sp. NBC_01023]
MNLTTADIVPGQAAMQTGIGPLLRTLRPDLTEAAFTAFAAEAHRQGLVFTAAYTPDGRCVGVATHRTLLTSRGRLLFVDDLVTDPQVRSGGVGSLLMEELEARARRAGCTRIELDSGVANHGAHRFYHSHRMVISAHHFARDLSAE